MRLLVTKLLFDRGMGACPIPRSSGIYRYLVGMGVISAYQFLYRISLHLGEVEHSYLQLHQVQFPV